MKLADCAHELFAAELAIETPYTCEQIKAAVRDVWFQYDAREVPRGNWARIVREAARAAHALQMPLGTVASQIAAALIDEDCRVRAFQKARKLTENSAQSSGGRGKNTPENTPG